MASTNLSPEIPAFHGIVETTLHALRLIHAARQGIIPRVTRRLNDAERRTMIKSGAIFIFSVTESGIKRWTDGLLWSPSRIHSNYLVYREINERTNSRGHGHRRSMEEPSIRGVHVSGERSRGLSLSTNQSSDIKRDGLIKKTITVCIDNTDLHLISYYTAADLRTGVLKTPSSRMDIMGMTLQPSIFRGSNFRNPPKVEMGPDGKARFVPEDSPPPQGKDDDSTHHSSNWTSDHMSHSPIEGPFARHSPTLATTASSVVPVARTVCSSYSRIVEEGNGWAESYANSRLSRRHDSWSETALAPTQSSTRRTESNGYSNNTTAAEPPWSPNHAPTTWQADMSIPEGSSTAGIFLDNLQRASTNTNNFVKREDDDSSLPFNQRYQEASNTNQHVGARPNSATWMPEETKQSTSSPSTASFSSAASTAPTSAATVERFNDYHRHTYESSWSPNTHALDPLPHSPASTHSSSAGYYPSSSTTYNSRSAIESASDAED